jgi:hypothetical protein
LTAGATLATAAGVGEGLATAAAKGEVVVMSPLLGETFGSSHVARSNKTGKASAAAPNLARSSMDAMMRSSLV